MAKILGFNNIYKGLSENEAWQRIYEFGKNLMPIKDRLLQLKYNRMFNIKTKVVRDGAVKKVMTDKLVPGDIIIIEKGDYVPVDGKVKEEVSLEFDKDFKPIDEKFRDNNEKIVYQGMRVKQGKAVIEAIRTGDDTYFGSYIKEIDCNKLCDGNFGRELHKYFNIIGIIGLILMIFGAFFSFITNKADIIGKMSTAGYAGLLLFLVTVPIGSILIFIVKLEEQKDILKKSNLMIKKYDALLKARKASVICIDERFLDRNYEKYIQRFYKAGITIAVISEKGKDEVKELAKKAGIYQGDIEAVSGDEIEALDGEKFYQAICNNIIFYNVNSKQKNKIIEGFSKLNIKTISVIDGIEDLPILKYTNIAICDHNRKKSLEYEFAGANISGTELTSIYSLIKGSFMVKSYFNSYVQYYIMFQLPVILSLLVALLVGIDLKIFYIQTLMFIMIIVPLLLLLINADYSEDKIFELKDKDKSFVLNCVKFGFAGFFIGILGILIYILLGFISVKNILRIGIVTVIFTTISFGFVMIGRRKFKVIKECKADNPKVEVKIKKERKHLDFSKLFGRKEKVEDVKDELL